MTFIIEVPEKLAARLHTAGIDEKMARDLATILFTKAAKDPETLHRVLEKYYESEKRRAARRAAAIRFWEQELWNNACSTWADRIQIPLGPTPQEWYQPRFEVLKSRTNWLDLVRCRECGSYWYVAFDTVDDDWYLQRLTEAEACAILDADVWPSTFDAFNRFWPAIPPNNEARNLRPDFPLVGSSDETAR